MDFPDPDPDGGFGLGSEAATDVDVNDPKVQDAFTECEELMPGGSPLNREFDQAQQEGILELTKCMRKKGVDFPDPRFDESGKVVIGDLLGKVNLRDPELLDALEKCRSKIPAGLATP